VLVAIKVAALTLFIVLTLPVIKTGNFTPFAPLGFRQAPRHLGAAASIFFAYVGFDAVSTAAEETKNPQRNMPIGLIGSLAICTIFYLLVAAGVIGAIGAQPVLGARSWRPAALARLQPRTARPGGQGISCRLLEGSAGLDAARNQLAAGRQLLGLAAGLALPSVILMMMFGQTRIFFVMSRDGLLPEAFSRVHPKFKTPHVITILTGMFVALFAAFFPVGQLADISNSGTLFAFAAVSIAVLVLRRPIPTASGRSAPRRSCVTAPLAIIGCLYLFFSLSTADQADVRRLGSGRPDRLFQAYSYRRSHVRSWVLRADRPRRAVRIVHPRLGHAAGEAAATGARAAGGARRTP
jgi:APA family basic amino acid/polyamine antiporter